MFLRSFGFTVKYYLFVDENRPRQNSKTLRTAACKANAFVPESLGMLWLRCWQRFRWAARCCWFVLWVQRSSLTLRFRFRLRYPDVLANIVPWVHFAVRSGSLVPCPRRSFSVSLVARNQAHARLAGFLPPSCSGSDRSPANSPLRCKSFRPLGSIAVARALPLHKQKLSMLPRVLHTSAVLPGFPSAPQVPRHYTLLLQTHIPHRRNRARNCIHSPIPNTDRSLATTTN